LGLGTERSEEHLQTLFPGRKILRIDRDSTRKKNAMSELLAEVGQGGPCILVGTQMLAKGHHFPLVTLVAIIDADGGLFSSDFRGAERMGQLITQVAGRAGRADKPGKVILQSHQSEHPLLHSLLFEGYAAFSEHLLRERQLADMPPYCFMALVKAESADANMAMEFLKLARLRADSISPGNPDLHYLGPLPAVMERRQGRFRFILQIKSGHRGKLKKLLGLLAAILEKHPDARKVRWAIDVDPQDMS